MGHPSHSSDSPLQLALDAWAGRDAMGGFITAGAALFPGWQARRACRSPHREDRTPSFSIYRGSGGAWRFKDHATGEQGGLVGFVMLAGMDGKAAAKWLMAGAFTAEAPRRGENTKTDNFSSPSPRLCASAVPYSLNDAELLRCKHMSEALLKNPSAIARFAAVRGWHPGTLHNLALDGCLGLHEDHLVMIYPTGAKLRLKPLETAASPKASPACQMVGMAFLPSHLSTPPAGEFLNGDGGDAIPTSNTNGMAATPPAPKFVWMFGKPDALWLGDRISSSTERVHITEGETAAISLIEAGLDDGIAEIVMAVPGASGWRDAWAEPLRGREIILWPDADAPGERLMQRIATALIPFAREIRINQSNTGGTKP